MAATLQRKRKGPQERFGEGTKSQEGAIGGSSPYLIKLGAIGFVLGGLSWIAVNLLSLRFAPTPPPPSLLPPVLAVWLSIGAVLLSMVGIIGLDALQRGSYGRLGRAGFYAIIGSSAAIVVAEVANLLGSAALEWLVYPVGMVGMVVGFLLYGVATVQAGVLPSWYGVVLVAYLPISLFFAVYANIWVGAVQLILGSVLWRRRALPIEKSAPGGQGLRTTANTHSVRLRI